MADSTLKALSKNGGWGRNDKTQSTAKEFSSFGSFHNQLSPINRAPKAPTSLPKKEAYEYERLPQKPGMRKITILKREDRPSAEAIALINAEFLTFVASSSAPSSPSKEEIQSTKLYLEGERALTGEAIDKIVGEMRLFNPSPEHLHPKVFEAGLTHLAGEIDHTASAITHYEGERSLFEPVQKNTAIVKLPWATSTSVRKVSKLLTYAEAASDQKAAVCVKGRDKEQVQDETKEQVHDGGKKKAKKAVKDTPKKTKKKGTRSKMIKHVRFASDNPHKLDSHTVE